MTGRLEGKRILITGGSRGLGREFCSMFTRAGAQVAFTWLRNAEGAAETEQLCGEARAFQVSVTDAKATREMVKSLEADWGGIDVLVNNAAVTQNLPVALMEEEDWDLVMDTNVKGTFLTSRAVLPGMMRRKGGLILNLSSLAGVRMIESPVHYYTSKAAIKGLTEVLAKEVARHNIRVLALAPGLLEAGVGRNLPDYKLEDYLEQNALGRVGTLREVAELATFLISDENSYMNGETVVIDGGI